MGVLADFFAATDATAPRYTEHPDEFPDRVEAKRLTSLEVSTLLALLTGREWTEALMDELETIVFENDGELLIHRFPPAMVERLAGASAETIATVGAAWAETEELRWPPSDGRDFVQALASLCQAAQKASRSVYLWNCV